MSQGDIVRVLRIYEFSGPREAVENQVCNSLQGERTFGKWGGTITIRAATLGTFPEVLQPAQPALTADDLRQLLKTSHGIYPDNDSLYQGYQAALTDLITKLERQ